MCRANEKWCGQFSENFDVRLKLSDSYLRQQENVRIVSCAKQSVSDATTEVCGQQVLVIPIANYFLSLQSSGNFSIRGLLHEQNMQVSVVIPRILCYIGKEL